MTQASESRRTHNRTYYLNHREETLTHQALYRATHCEELLAYRTAHRDEWREKDAKKLAEFTEWLQILRTNNGCEDCETHEGRLEHHHIDPDTKVCSVSQMANCSLDALEDELEKCVVLCVPCHNKRHVALKQKTEGSGLLA